MKNKLSICIPTYNRFEVLSETLENINEVSKHNFVFEVVIVDNNENDKAKNIIRPFLSKNRKFKYFKNKRNLGGEKNFKECVKKASAEYIWIVADDDIVSSNAINSVHFAVEKNFNLIIINWAVYSKNLKHKLFDEILDTKITFSSDKNFILKKFGTSLSFISSIIFQKKLFNEKNLTLYDKFAPYGLSFLTFVFSLISNEQNKIYFEKTSLIMQRGFNSPRLNSTEYYYNVFADGTNLFFKEMIKLGYKKDSIKIARIKNFNNFIFKDLLNRKLENNDFSLAFNKSLYNFGDILLIKFKIYVIYFFPSIMFKIAKKIKSSFK